MIPFNQAVVRALHHYKAPVLTDYALGTLVFNLIIAGKVEDQQLRIRLHEPESRHYAQAIKFLVNTEIVTRRKEFPKDTVFNIVGQDRSDPLEVFCAVDPFGFLSHLTAMEYHGLTDRFSNTIYATTPGPREWREGAQQRMRSDLGGKPDAYIAAEFPRLRVLDFSEIEKRPVRISMSKNAGAFVVLQQGAVRVSSVGRTFLDMLRAPDRCGGIHHVLAAFEKHASMRRRLILDEFERNGNHIDKVRAGYVLEEICGIRDPMIEAWQAQSVQRGGSRKLDPSAPYSSDFSERWCLSLNHQ